MKFICVQPAIDYYTWQVEVMINNFIKNGINPNDIEIVSSYYGSISDKWRSLANRYNTVRFFFYTDTRIKYNYISSIRPHLLHKHWLKFPELEKETIFYHDCDIILSKPVNFTNLLNDNVCYVSNTVSYIGAKYIRSKGEHLLDIMTDVVGINKQLVIDNEKDSGGAQYLLKNISAEFWNKVYWDAENMYKPIVKLQNGDHSNPFQIWCADMWSVLWNLWLIGKEVKVTDAMSFSWATSGMHDWDKHPIYHNAGATGQNKEIFYKGIYQAQTPYNIKLEDFSDKFCSFNYVKEILETKEVTCLT
jgi:hypothetical protein